jgi:hypothetical protein
VLVPIRKWVHVMSDIKTLIAEINNIATDKGWRENEAGKDQSGAWFAAYIALVHSEVTAALEAHREGIWSDTKEVSMARYGGSESDTADRPVGVGPKLADAIVRILDMVDIWGIDIEYELNRVFTYLRQRPYEPSPKIGGDMSDTGCPMCGSDDYDVLESSADGEPDYSGQKRCNECGEEWT